MQSKQTEYRIIGMFIGLVIGVLAGFGELNMTKKSLRHGVMWPVVGITAVAFVVGGYRYGSKLGKEAYIEEMIGRRPVMDNFVKDSRYWVGITTWTDKRNNTQHQLMTARNHSGVLVSVLNGISIINHQIRTANQNTVPKHHANGTSS